MTALIVHYGLLGAGVEGEAVVLTGGILAARHLLPLWASNRRMMRDRAAVLGFEMVMSDESRIYNTFDAHRLFHWAESSGRQTALKMKLFDAYFTKGENPSDPEVLVVAAAEAGLDPVVAREILASRRYADEVRKAEQLWQSRGISAVPAVVVNDKYLISGGQPPEAFETALRKIAAEAS